MSPVLFLQVFDEREGRCHVARAERFQTWETSAITVWLRFDVNDAGMLIFLHCTVVMHSTSILIQFGPKDLGVIKAKEIDLFSTHTL